MKKTEVIHVRITSIEKQKIKQHASNTGLKLSQFIRKTLLEKEPVFLSEENRKEIYELKKIGLEMNRTLNLYHEKRTEHSPFFMKLRKVISKYKS